MIEKLSKIAHRILVAALLLTSFAVLHEISSQTAFAQEAQTDYNSDGVSDYTLIDVATDGALFWKNTLSGVATTSVTGSLGKQGDHITLADWLGTGVPQRGVVGLDGSQIIWKIVDGSGIIQQRTFGQKDDLVLAGGDFNGNGIDDAVVARLKGGHPVWEVSLDMFSAYASPATKITFGSNGDRAFYASPDGVSDWLAVIGKGSRKRSRLKMRNVLTGEVRNFARLPAFASKEPRPRPFPVKQADGTDALGFILSGGLNTRVAFLKLDGFTLSRTELPGKGDVIVGNFNDGPGEEVAIKTASGFFIYNPVLGSTAGVATTNGIAVDQININQVTDGKSTPPKGNNGNNNGSEPPPSSGDVKSCRSVIDISSLPNMLYKNENIHGSRGRTWLDQGHRMGGQRTVSVIGLDGVAFACFGLYACDQPFGCRYYQAMCGDGLGNSQFANAARAHGNGSSYALVTSGNGTCYRFKADVPRYGNIIK